MAAGPGLAGSLSVHRVQGPYGRDGSQIVPDEAVHGDFRIVEGTGAGWFHWPEAYGTREAAEVALKNHKEIRP